MNELLSMLVATQVLSHDLHYQSKGKSFYALHILADLCKDGLDGTMDQIREAYYMGELKTLPPCDCEIFEKAIEMVRNNRQQIGGEDKNLALILRLRAMCGTVIGKIEELKKEQLLSGTVSILDGISAKMQTNYALLDRCTLSE